MRLTDEDIRRHKENIYSVECVRGKVKMSDGDIIHNLCDTIEALQQENEQNRRTINLLAEDLKKQTEARVRLQHSVNEYERALMEVEG